MYEVLLSGRLATQNQARAVLVKAGVPESEFVDAHHGLHPDHVDRGDGWLAYRAESLEAAEHSALGKLGWRLRIHRDARRLPARSDPPPGNPMAEMHAEVQRLRAEVNALRAGSPLAPIAGGALETPPWVISAEQHPAYLFRQTTQSMLSATGVVGASDLLVSQNSPAGMSVLVAGGQAWIPGTLGPSGGLFPANAGAQSSVANTNGGGSTTTGFPATFTTQGSYYAFNDGTVTLPVASANATNPRIDVVCATVQDAEYAGSSNQAVLQVVTGTAASSPLPPTIPANSVVLASVWVPAAATSITSGDLNDLRPQGVRVPFGKSSQRPAAGALGETFYETDIGAPYFYNGSAWSAMALVQGPFGPLYPRTGDLSNFTVSTGQFAYVTFTSALTMTLPSGAPMGAVCGAQYAGTGGLTIAANPGGSIYGVGVSGASSIKLGTQQAHVVLMYLGSYWVIVSGQQDTGWMALTLGSGVTAASTYAPSYGIVGNRVFLSGGVALSSASTVIASNLPAPISAVYLPLVGSSAPLGSSGVTVALASLAASSQSLAVSAPGSAVAYTLEGLSYRLS